MDLFGILANPGVGNLLLLIAAIIGILGSYFLYRLRLNDRRNATRRALRAEIESTATLDTWIREKAHGGKAPAQIVHPTTAYQGLVENIGLLTEDEIELVSEFYSQAIILNDALKWNREIDLQVNLVPNTVDKGRARRIRDIDSELNRLALLRWKADQILKKHLSEENKPIERMELPEMAGDSVSKYHPVLDSRLGELIEEGYFEPVESDPELYRLTEAGERFISKDVDSSDDYDLDHELSLT